ncbi:hypothetical protein M885DRAFT_591190 [Pelagophyceae sp. CCMP2097]|nr:hypothetical protein M885DRAFT_591190 [Pelagophyceae sp. CCMP2097]
MADGVLLVHGAGPLVWTSHGDFFGIRIRCCEAGIRLYAEAPGAAPDRSVCILEVPRDVVFVEFLSALCDRALWLDALAEVSLLRGPETYCALLKFEDGAEGALVSFLAACHDATFCLAPETILPGVFCAATDPSLPRVIACRALVVDAAALGRTAPRARPRAQSRAPRTTLSLRALAVKASGLRELPTCAVCFDRLDTSATLVEHEDFEPSPSELPFRGRWPKSRCVTCTHIVRCDGEARHGEARHKGDDFGGESRDDDDESLVSRRLRCAACGHAESLWACVVCGYIGCGRYHREHAKEHYDRTSHAYSIELRTRKIWDYVGDGYVHRLEREQFARARVRDDAPARPHRGGGPARDHGDVAADKFSSLATHYEAVLAQQLEAQRKDYEHRAASAAAAAAAAALARDCGALAVPRLNLDRAHAECAAATAACALAADALRLGRAVHAKLALAAKKARETTLQARRVAAQVRARGLEDMQDVQMQIRDVQFALEARAQLGEGAGAALWTALWNVRRSSLESRKRPYLRNTGGTLVVVQNDQPAQPRIGGHRRRAR